jgi:hypothetical protein
MRFRELLEYKRDITANNLGQQLLNRITNDKSANYGFNVGEESKEISRKLEQVEKADPTPNKQYTEWLVRRYIDGSISRFEDVLSTTADMLERYHTLKVHRKLPSALMDIGKVKTKGQISDLDFSVSTAYNEFIKDKPEVISKGDAKEILNNSEVRIIIPQDQDAACYYGQGTQWCTAAKKNNMFDEYHSQNNPLFVLIPKTPSHNGEKYQIRIASESTEIMDETDSPVDLSSILNRFINTDLEGMLTKYSVEAKYLIEFTSRQKLVHGINIIMKIINQQIPAIIDIDKDVYRLYNQSTNPSIVKEMPTRTEKTIEELNQLDIELLTDMVISYMNDNSVMSGLPFDNGGFNMMYYELNDGFAKWVREQYLGADAIHEFLYDNVFFKIEKGVAVVTLA